MPGWASLHGTVMEKGWRRKVEENTRRQGDAPASHGMPGSHQKLPGQSADIETFRESLASGHLVPRVSALRAMRGEVLSLGLSLLQHTSRSTGSPERGTEGQHVGRLTHDGKLCHVRQAV